MSSTYPELSFDRYWSEEWRAEFLSSFEAWINKARQDNVTKRKLNQNPQDHRRPDGPRRWKLVYSGGSDDYLFEIHVRLHHNHQPDPNRPKWVEFGPFAEDKLRGLITGNKLLFRRSRDGPGGVWTCTYECKAEGQYVPKDKDFQCEYLVELRERKLDPAAAAILEAAKNTGNT